MTEVVVRILLLITSFLPPLGLFNDPKTTLPPPFYPRDVSLSPIYMPLHLSVILLYSLGTLFPSVNLFSLFAFSLPPSLVWCLCLCLLSPSPLFLSFNICKNVDIYDLPRCSCVFYDFFLQITENYSFLLFSLGFLLFASYI